MNRLRIENSIGDAYAILAEVGIAEKGKLDNAFRGQISGLGASICTGHLLASIAFFSEKGEAKADRTRLLTAIYRLVQKNHADAAEPTLFAYVKRRYADAGSRAALKEEILDYAIALKLAMNLYQRFDSPKQREEPSEAAV